MCVKDIKSILFIKMWPMHTQYVQNENDNDICYIYLILLNPWWILLSLWYFSFSLRISKNSIYNTVYTITQYRFVHVCFYKSLDMYVKISPCFFNRLYFGSLQYICSSNKILYIHDDFWVLFLLFFFVFVQCCNCLVKRFGRTSNLQDSADFIFAPWIWGNSREKCILLCIYSFKRFIVEFCCFLSSILSSLFMSIYIREILIFILFATEK